MRQGSSELVATADTLYEKVDKVRVDKARYEAFKDSTGYTVDGLQRLVDWLRDEAPKA
jgi:aminoglycoside phosphotransferase (APT) family kinase protein